MTDLSNRSAPICDPSDRFWWLIDRRYIQHCEVERLKRELEVAEDLLDSLNTELEAFLKSLDGKAVGERFLKHDRP